MYRKRPSKRPKIYREEWKEGNRERMTKDRGEIERQRLREREREYDKERQRGDESKDKIQGARCTGPGELEVNRGREPAPLPSRPCWGPELKSGDGVPTGWRQGFSFLPGNSPITHRSKRVLDPVAGHLQVLGGNVGDCQSRLCPCQRAPAFPSFPSSASQEGDSPPFPLPASHLLSPPHQ